MKTLKTLKTLKTPAPVSAATSRANRDAPGVMCDDPECVARRFQALSDATRIEILQKLAHGELCVCDLQGELGAAQSRLSFHLRKLKDAGLVADRREGRWSYYSLVPHALAALAGILADVGTGARRPDAHPGACVCPVCGA